MPQLYFDEHDGEQLTRDDTGLRLDGLDAMRQEAIKALPDVARDVLPDGKVRTMSVTARDESGTALFRAVLEFRCEWLAGAS